MSISRQNTSISTRPIAPNPKQPTSEQGPQLWDELLNEADGQVGCGIQADNEMFLPIHNFIWFTDEEVAVIDHPAFQRLGNIFQLGQAHLVYRGATHKRIEHVLGATHVAQMMVKAIDYNHRKRNRQQESRDRCDLAPELSKLERIFVRLSTLLHDIGHLPAGHTLEDELHLLSKHDEMHRLNLVLDRDQWCGITSVPLRKTVDDQYRKFLPSGKLTPSNLVCAIVAKDAAQPEELPDGFRLQVCRDIVGNTICADFLDYLHRDWLHIGKPKEFDKRIFQYMEVRTAPSTGDSEFVISLGQSRRLRTDAITAIVNLLEYRYQLAESVLFHRTKCKAAAMLERALMELAEMAAARGERDQWLSELEKRLLDHSDYSALTDLLNMAKDCEAAALPLKALLHRKLYRDVSTTFYRDITPETEVEKLRQTYSDPNSKQAPFNRLKAVRLLEEDFGLPAGSLAIYCPDARMNAKLPEVSIHLDGGIKTYNDWNKEFSDTLDGGHIAAQITRFHRLWRVHIVLQEEQYVRWSERMIDTFHDAVRKLVLDQRGGSMLHVDDLSEDIAKTLASMEKTPYSGKTIAFARAARRSPQQTYLFGAPCVSSFFKQ